MCDFLRFACSCVCVCQSRRRRGLVIDRIWELCCNDFSILSMNEFFFVKKKKTGRSSSFFFRFFSCEMNLATTMR